jgi:hypothetical protein
MCHGSTVTSLLSTRMSPRRRTLYVRSYPANGLPPRPGSRCHRGRELSRHTCPARRFGRAPAPGHALEQPCEVPRHLRPVAALRERQAYAVLTLLESIAGTRRQGAATFQIDLVVLDTIGRLSSTRGDTETIRKFAPGANVQLLSGSDTAWLEAAIRRVGRRMGEHAAGAQLTRLSMHDLPAL